MPNAWDVGSALLFASLGFEAIATTSGGFAASRGRLDGAMTKEEVLAHAGELAGAVDIPVSADLENCFADDPGGVAATITAAAGLGLAGGSVEDFTGDRDNPIYELAHAAERVRAAVEAAHGDFVVTARAENYLHGRKDLADTIARLQAYQEAGADVLFAPRSWTPPSCAAAGVRRRSGQRPRPAGRAHRRRARCVGREPDFRRRGDRRRRLRGCHQRCQRTA